MTGTVGGQGRTPGRPDPFSSAASGRGGAPGRVAPDPFASAIGGRRAPQVPQPGGLGFSSAIGGDPIGGDVIWQQPGARDPFSSSAPGRGGPPGRDPFSSAIGGSSISSFSDPMGPPMGSPTQHPAPAPGQPDPFGQPIGGARHGSRFAFSNATPGDPFSNSASGGGSLFASNPFFAAPAPGAGGFSSALGGDMLQTAKDADALNNDTFGSGSFPPGPPDDVLRSDLSPHTAPVIPGANSFGALGNGTGAPGFGTAAPGFGTFSDLHTDSVPFAPPSKQQQRHQSRFAFPSGGEEPENPPEGSNFSLFG